MPKEHGQRESRNAIGEPTITRSTSRAGKRLREKERRTVKVMGHSDAGQHRHTACYPHEGGAPANRGCNDFIDELFWKACVKKNGLF